MAYITSKIKNALWPDSVASELKEIWDKQNAADWGQISGVQNMAIAPYDKYYRDQMKEFQRQEEEARRMAQEREKTKQTSREWVSNDDTVWTLHDIVWFTADGPQAPKHKGLTRATVVRLPAEDGPDVFVAYQRASANNGSQKPVMAFKDVERAKNYAATLAKLNEANTPEENPDPYPAGMAISAGSINGATTTTGVISSGFTHWTAK